MDNSPRQELAHKVADPFKDIPSVTAIALGGSMTAGVHDLRSDIDLYIFSPSVIPLCH